MTISLKEMQLRVRDHLNKLVAEKIKIRDAKTSQTLNVSAIDEAKIYSRLSVQHTEKVMKDFMLLSWVDQITFAQHCDYNWLVALLDDEQKSALAILA